MEIVLPRLVTRGGPIIFVQLENELGSAGYKGDDIAWGAVGAEENVKHVLYYYNLIRSHGVDIPVVDINKIPDKGSLMDGLVDSGGGWIHCDKSKTIAGVKNFLDLSSYCALALLTCSPENSSLPISIR